MRVTVIGTGYVGLVTGACLSETGNHVICVDKDAEKIAVLNGGEIPIHEPGLDSIVHRNAAAGAKCGSMSRDASSDWRACRLASGWCFQTNSRPRRNSS